MTRVRNINARPLRKKGERGVVDAVYHRSIAWRLFTVKASRGMV